MEKEAVFIRNERKMQRDSSRKIVGEATTLSDTVSFNITVVILIRHHITAQPH